MKYLASLALAFAFAQATLIERSDNPLGIDVASYQGNVDWSSVANNKIKFACVKATEGTYYTNSYFDSQYGGAAGAGLIRAAYHFTRPDKTSGADQANYFINNGDNPYGTDPCYGVSVSDMASWIRDFSDAYQTRTRRYPVIYTTTGWWNECTGSNADFAGNNPLWIADWAAQLGPLPAGWEYTSFWRYADSGPNPGDADLWNGDYESLQRMARDS